MYCPQCGAEYREGFTRCADCGVPLVAVLPTEPPASDTRLVTVFESTDAAIFAMAKGALEDAAIPFWQDDSEMAARLVTAPILFPLCRLMVPDDREAEARAVLDMLASEAGGAGDSAPE
jgi:hypothetical protein